MKVLVYQSHVKQHDNRPFRHELAIASRESFEKYAEKHGYDYRCDETGWIKPLEQSGHTKFFYAMQGLAPSDYDYVIYADSDVIASPNSPAFPLKDGFSGISQINGYANAVRTPEITEKQKVWVNNHLKAYGIEDHEYLNTGVWSVCRETRNHIWNTWRSIRKKCKEPELNGVLLDQPVINACIYNRKINHLSWKWNAISDVLQPYLYEQAYFIHYGGLLGSIIWKAPRFLGKPNVLRERVGQILFNSFCSDMGRYGKLPLKEAVTEIINKQFNHG